MSNTTYFCCLYDKELDGDDEAITTVALITRTNIVCKKKPSWYQEVLNNPHIMSLDKFGEFITCLVCKNYRYGRGYKPLMTRRPFYESNWVQTQTYK